MTERLDPTNREEQARREIGRTDIGRGVKWALFLAGLLTLFAVPAVQTYYEMHKCAESRHETPGRRHREILAAVPRATAAGREHDGGWFAKTLRGNAVLLQAIEAYDKDLQAESLLTRFVLPPAQALLAYAGSGNEQAYIGRQGWLFYRPGIDYCTGPGFLDPRSLSRRIDSGSTRQPAPQPDPRRAIFQFQRQLAERNIRLMLMPIPDKATIHPEQFSARYDGRQMVVHNPSYRQFLDELQAEGVLVCDVTDVLAHARDRSGGAVYLATDTHWRPEAVEWAAAELARLIGENIQWSEAATDHYWRPVSRTVANRGDIARMLKLGPGQDLSPEEVVTIRPAIDDAGAPWQPDRAAEVLLLGDSFANIYSLEMMNWGASAGLAEQLVCALNRPVDAILRNDDGAYATREILGRELAQGNDRLAGKRLVVWQFAARELAVGDWRLLDITLRQPPTAAGGPRPIEEEPIDEALIVSGTIAAKSAAPRAGQIPYAHHIFTLDLTDLQVHRGTLTEPKIAAYLFSMKDYQNTPAYSWPVGERVKLRLQPWSPRFFARYGRINRSETEDKELERPWWGEVIQ